MLDTSFLNKNMHRRYPLRADASCVSEQGNSMPLNLLSAARFLSDLSHMDVYIKKIVIDDNNINITINSGATCLGYFNGKITTDFQTLKLNPLVRYASGYITIGAKDALNDYQGSNTFTSSTAKFEDSLVVCKSPPAVSGIRVGDTVLTGMVKFTYDNINEVVDANAETLNLSVDNVNLILSKNDVSSKLENCPTKYIGSVHGVQPDSNGNINIYGISPVTIQVGSGAVKIATPAVGFEEVCQNKKNVVPPIPANNPNDYEDVLTAEKEEWKTWPDYAPFYPDV